MQIKTGTALSCHQDEQRKRKRQYLCLKRLLTKLPAHRASEVSSAVSILGRGLAWTKQTLGFCPGVRASTYRHKSIMISVTLQCWNSAKYHPQKQTQCESQGGQTQECKPRLLYLAKQWSPSARQTLSGKGPQRGFCRLLIQWHSNECAHTRCLVCVLCSTLSSTTLLCSLPGCPSQHRPCCALKPLRHRAGGMDSSFFLFFSFLKEIFLFVFNYMWRSKDHYEGPGHQAWQEAGA